MRSATLGLGFAKRARRATNRVDSASAAKKRQKIGIDLTLVGRRHGVRSLRVDLQCRVGDELGRNVGVGHGGDLVVIAVKDQRGYVDRLKVLGDIGLSERGDAKVGGRETGEHRHGPVQVQIALRNGRPLPVDGEMRIDHRIEVLAAVRQDPLSQSVEIGGRRPVRVARRLHDHGDVNETIANVFGLGQLSLVKADILFGPFDNGIIKGYVYAPRNPQPIVKDLEDWPPELSNVDTAYRSIGNDWYLFELRH
jgi:hypothetical protein